MRARDLLHILNFHLLFAPTLLELQAAPPCLAQYWQTHTVTSSQVLDCISLYVVVEESVRAGPPRVRSFRGPMEGA